MPDEMPEGTTETTEETKPAEAQEPTDQGDGASGDDTALDE